MDKLRINLIPPELKALAKKEARQVFINRICILLLGLLLIFTAGIFSVVIYQSNRLNLLTQAIEKEREQIESYTNKEAVVRLLKNRIDTINQFTNNRYKQGEIFKLISGLFPQGVILSSIQIDKTSAVVISGTSEGTQALQQFFDTLSDPKSNEGKIASVAVQSLGQSPKGNISFDLMVNLEKGVNP